MRKVTPKLPEASGPRKGVSGCGDTAIKLLILGDSAAAGVGANQQEESLSGQTLRHLYKSLSVKWQLNAQTGRTTSDTIRVLDAIPDEDIDAVVLSLGVNDVTSGISPNHWLALQQELCEKLKCKFNCKMIIYSAVPPMHLFTALPQPLRWYLGRGALKLNLMLDQWLQSEPDSQLVKFSLTEDPGLLAEDGFHPSAKLYSIWGEQVAKIINANFKPE